MYQVDQGSLCGRLEGAGRLGRKGKPGGVGSLCGVLVRELGGICQIMRVDKIWKVGKLEGVY